MRNGVSNIISFAIQLHAGKCKQGCPWPLALFSKSCLPKGGVGQLSFFRSFGKLVAMRNQKLFNKRTVNESWSAQPVYQSIGFAVSLFPVFIVSHKLGDQLSAQVVKPPIFCK